MLMIKGRVMGRATPKNGHFSNLAANIRSYICSVFLVWLAVFFYRNDIYYRHLLDPKSQKILLALALVYSVSALFFYIYSAKNKIIISRGFIIIRGLWRLLKAYKVYLKCFPTDRSYQLPRPTEEERVSILFAVVKFFFLPLMIYLTVANYH